MSSKKKNSLLWRISPPNGQADSYVFGTMHVRDARAFGWLELAEAHLAECQVFATEFDFSEMNHHHMEQALKMPDDKTLSDFLPNSAKKNLHRFCKKHLKASPEIFEKQHPMAVMTILTQSFLAEDMPLSLDETLWQTAGKLTIERTGVETFAEQIETVRKIPLETHFLNLASMLKNLKNYRRHLKKMAALYEKGEIQQLNKAAKRDAKGMRKVLLYERNALMVKRLCAIAVEKPIFAAVGAGHLAGSKGMLRLLKKAGFGVAPVLFQK